MTTPRRTHLGWFLLVPILPVLVLTLLLGADFRSAHSVAVATRLAHYALATTLLLAAGSAIATSGWLKRNTRSARAIVTTTVVGSITIAMLAIACVAADSWSASLWPDLLVQVAGWSLLGFVLVLYIDDRAHHVPAKRSGPLRVLAVGAHPDDLELGCGATLARWIDAGSEVHALVLTSGEKGGDSATRPTEALDGGTFLGLASVQVLSFPDTKLEANAAELVVAIEAMIRRVAPDIILTHSFNDAHQDHMAVHLATVRAARQHPTVLCYESPSATNRFQPTFFVDVDDYVPVKVAAIRSHRDQLAKPYMTPERIWATAAYRGGQAKVHHAEAFEPVRLLAPKAWIS